MVPGTGGCEGGLAARECHELSGAMQRQKNERGLRVNLRKQRREKLWKARKTCKGNAGTSPQRCATKGYHLQKSRGG